MLELTAKKNNQTVIPQTAVLFVKQINLSTQDYFNIIHI